MDRNRILLSLFRLTLSAAGLALADSALLEPRIVNLKRVRVPAAEPFPHLAGLEIAHFSDLHVGGRGWRRRTIEAAIDAVNRQDVHLVAITGDFLGSGSGVPAAVELLSKLRRDVPRYAVLGNHDHVYGTRPLGALLGAMKEMGIRVLVNRAETVPLQCGEVWVAGVDDGYTLRDDLDQALAPLRERRAPVVLLTHYPEVATRPGPGRVQLILAGHSHGGQIRLPVIAGLVQRLHARTRYGKGLYNVNGNPLFVTSGVGTSGVPLRFLNPPEVAVIRFYRGRPRTGGYTLHSVSTDSLGRNGAAGRLAPRVAPSV